MYNFRLSLRDIYNYDESIFDNLILPTYEDVVLDKDSMIDLILKESDFFNLVSWYSDPVKVKEQIGKLSTRYSHKWQHIMDIWCVSYNPIYNYDMSEHEVYESDSTSDTTSKGQVTTYDSDTFHDNDKNIYDGEGTMNYDRVLTRQGNIGVMSTQNMAQQEIDLWNKLDIYKTICDDIVCEICTLVYA